MLWLSSTVAVHVCWLVKDGKCKHQQCKHTQAPMDLQRLVTGALYKKARNIQASCPTAKSPHKVNEPARLMRMSNKAPNLHMSSLDATFLLIDLNLNPDHQIRLTPGPSRTSMRCLHCKPPASKTALNPAVSEARSTCIVQICQIVAPSVDRIFDRDSPSQTLNHTKLSESATNLAVLDFRQCEGRGSRHPFPAKSVSSGFII